MKGVETPPTLSKEDEALLDRVWAKVAPPKAKDVVAAQWSKPTRRVSEPPNVKRPKGA